MPMNTDMFKFTEMNGGDSSCDTISLSRSMNLYAYFPRVNALILI